ncbi:MAG: AmmeMemoRadiSam system protein B [Candidatus Berkelbacteria bacterium]|nr:AmmeMemoRadiSam system protein B [Candidatus Berkelbacteria bacterium]
MEGNKKNWRTPILISVAVLFLAGLFFLTKTYVLSPISEQRISALANIPVVIVPHFDDFADKRAELLKNVGEKTKVQIAVVVSVNHHNSGTANIITADRNWKLADADMQSDKNLVAKLSSFGIATADPTAFANEHGITNVLSDVGKNLTTDFLPIIIRDTTPRDQIDKLADWLNANISGGILVASVDFSHYQPNAIAKIHDQFSISALTKLDADKTWSAETDSPQTLYLAEKVAENQNAKNFNLFYNSNSGEKNKTDDAETTSVVLGYYSDKLADQKVAASTSFLVAGDAMFDRDVWNSFKTKGLERTFDNFGTRTFRGSDISLLNLEGPISATPVAPADRTSLNFNFQPQTAGILKYLNVSEVSLANNHTNNAGASGFATTKLMLEKSGVKYFGQPESFNADVSVLRIDGEIPTTIIGIMALDNFDETALETKIKLEKAADRAVIIFPHWGIEYAPKHSTSQENLARSWISTGADLVVGSHPHVVEDFQIISGKPVIYSLGNFVFDQFFSRETQEGLILAGTISKDKITLSFLPTIEKNIQPEFMIGAAKTAKISSIFDINSNAGFSKLTSDTIEIDR